MASVFLYNKAFNNDIGGWNVVGVTNMNNMFRYSEFNTDISGWNVTEVTNMAYMFDYAPFNQNISGWDVAKVTDFTCYSGDLEEANKPTFS